MNRTDAELVSMSKSYEVKPDGTYVAHEAYREINEQVADGRPWAKCPNCGLPYPLDMPGASISVCSEACYQAYASYVMNGER